MTRRCRLRDTFMSYAAPVEPHAMPPSCPRDVPRHVMSAARYRPKRAKYRPSTRRADMTPARIA